MYSVRTKIVTAVDISGWTANDTTYFIPLVQKTAEHFPVREVSADKAYLSHKNLQAGDAVGGSPFIPFTSNTLEPAARDSCAWTQMYHYFLGLMRCKAGERYTLRYVLRRPIIRRYSRTKSGDSTHAATDRAVHL